MAAGPSKHILVVTIMGFVLALFSALGGCEGLDARLHDTFFRQREIFQQSPTVDERIVIIELDNQAFTSIGQPVSRWADDYALLIGRLFESGATVVGFDFLFHPSLQKLPSQDAERIYSEIDQLALLVLEQNVVLIDSFQQETGETLTSIDTLHAVAESKQNVGFNNLHTDPDGIVRNLGLFFFQQEPRTIKNFSGRLCELAQNQPLTFQTFRDKNLSTDGKLLINYPGPPHDTFQRERITEILAGKKLDLRDKICLIGPVYDASNDLHNTPLGLGWGIEVHAAALNTLLSEQYLVHLGPWSDFLFTLVGVALAYALATRAPTQTFLLGGFCLLVSYLVFSFFLFVRTRSLAPITAPLLATILSGVFTQVAQYRALESSRRYVKAVLGRFVSPQVMEELLASPDNLQLGGRHKRITVLFTDINNFTPLCEKKTPQEVIVMLNEFFNEMLEIIFRYNGTVKQFVGDEIMVMYGAPNDLEDHARRAVLTARDMVARLEELKKQKGDKAGFYEVKVGIHSGDVVVGNVGNEKRSEYAAVGDPVNTAARIEGLTKELEEAILLSEVTLEEIGGSLDGVEFVSKGPQTFKGKADQMEVYGVRWS